MSAVADAIGVSRPHLSATQRRGEPRRRGRPPLPDAEMLADIRRLIADLPTYGYRRVHALLRREAEENGRAAPNLKRIYRIMKLHGLLLQRHSGRGADRRHEGRIAVATRNSRWCSDGLEIGCDNEKVRIAFALDCCNREAMSYVATTGGITAEDVRDPMVATVEHRFGQVNALPHAIEWLTDNGSCYTAHDTRRFARDIGLIPRTTPVESPQSNGMAEAFVARSSAITPASAHAPTPALSSNNCQDGSTIIIACIRAGLSATDRRASLSAAQSMRACQTFRGQQHMVHSVGADHGSKRHA